jgi:hypothetical protein
MSDVSPSCAKERTFVSRPLRPAGSGSTAVSRPGAATPYSALAASVTQLLQLPGGLLSGFSPPGNDRSNWEVSKFRPPICGVA